MTLHKLTIKQRNNLMMILENDLRENSAEELREFLDYISFDETVAMAQFVEKFDISPKIQRILATSDITASEILDEIAQKFENLEENARQNDAEVERDYRYSQGWNI